MLKTTELLNRYVAFEEMRDNFFIEQKEFTLEAIYSLHFSSNVDKLFWWNSEETDALMIKLSGDYYLVAIAPCDEYRDNRSSIYHLRCEKMDDLIFDHNLINEVPTPLDVIAMYPQNGEYGGVVFTIAHYNDEKDEVLQLIESDDDYYPRGTILYHRDIHLDATPVIEKYFLENNLNEGVNKSKKIKI